MRLVHVSHDDPTVLELDWMWLPSFIGQDHALMSKLQKELKEKFGGRQIREDTLSAIHQFVLDWLDAQYAMKGLREYLAAIHHVRQES
jgi:hypothetical protein